MKTITTISLLSACLLGGAASAKKYDNIIDLPKATAQAKLKKLPAAPSAEQVQNMAGKQQLYFIENSGQVADQHGRQRDDIDFKLSSGGVTVFVGDGALHYMFSSSRGAMPEGIKSPTPSPSGYSPLEKGGELPSVQSYRMDVELVGANKNAIVVKEDKQGYYENYYLPQCPDGVRANAYKKIRYKDVYPHIDWVLYVKGDKVEYEFVVQEGGRVSDIKLRYKGATKLSVNKDGSITAKTPMGSVSEPAPYCYQSNGKMVKSKYRLKGNELSFKTEAYTGVLTIDPQLKWATYYGGGQQDRFYAVACDTATDIYATGITLSFSNIATVGAHQVVFGGYDGMLIKFDSSGNRLWGTYYGGNATTQSTDICIDIFGAIYIGGITESTTGIATGGSHQSIYGGVLDGFVAKFNKDGVRIWGTYYGGNASDWGFGITSDEYGNVYLGGLTTSPNAIATVGAFKTTFTVGQPDAFLVKLDSGGVRKWGTYYGSGNGIDNICDISYDRNMGGMYVCGETTSPDSIATPGAHQEVYGGNYDAFIAKFDSSGALKWSTYYGGADFDSAASLVGTEGLVYVTGQTRSSNGISTPGAYQTSFAGGSRDCFLARFSLSGELVWGTYYGGSGDESAGEVCVTNGITDIFISGQTSSQSNIATAGSHQDTYGGGAGDGLMAKFVEVANTAGLVWATYYSGTNYEYNTNIATDKLDNVYLAGGTASANNISTPGSFKPTISGAEDAFLARFRNCEPPGAADTITGSIVVCSGSTHTYTTAIVPNALSYVWILPPGWTGSSTTNSITVTASDTPGIMTVIAINGCDGSDPTSLQVSIYLPLYPAITNNNGLLNTGTYATNGIRTGYR